MIRPHPPRWLKIIAAIYIAYLALVLLVATPLLNFFVPKIYREQTGRELQLGKILWLNPFTLEFSARGAGSAPTLENPATHQSTAPEVSAIQNRSAARNPDADDRRLWAFDTLKANVSLASLWRGHLVLDALELHGFHLQVEQTAADRFNFSDILDYRAQRFPTPPAADVPAVAEADNKPFPIEIDKFIFSAAQVSYRAPYAEEPFAATLTDLHFALANLSTLAEKTEPQQKPGAQPPKILVPALRGSDLALTLKAIELNFLREQQPFATSLRDLKIAIPALSPHGSSNYELSALDGSGGSVSIKGNAAIAQGSSAGDVQLRNLGLLPVWRYLANKLAFDMRGAQLDGDIHYAASWSGADASAPSYRLTASQIALRDVQLQARNDSESRVGFASLQLNDIQIDSAQPRAQIGGVLVDKLSVAGWNKAAQISLVDMFAFAGSEEPADSPPWQIQIDAIAAQNSDIHWRASQVEHLPLNFAALDLRARNLRWPDAAPLQIDAKTTLNDTAKITLNGTVVPATQSGIVNADVRDLPLTWGDVFLREKMRATVTSGVLAARAAIKLDNGRPLSVQSDGTIDKFELHALSPSASASSKPTDTRKLATWKKLEWRQLAVELPRQHIDVKRVIFTEPWAQFRINSDGTNNFQQLMLASAASDQNHQTAGKSGAAPSEKPWQFALDNIHIDRATIDFRDASLTNAFRTNFTELSGDVDGLNSNGKKAAKVGLRGTVDGYAPVALTGSVNPFAAKPTLNITLDMTNLDLAALTPYSGTYAGYQIDSGRLTVQLAYTLENDRIKGTNHIIVNQMQLGKQVSSPKVMDLPLRFAIYLLTDSNGVMDLGVDVAGDIDDPDFSVGNIIWKAFRNLIVKTVSSPFRALANIAGAHGEDDLDRVEFTAGSNRIGDQQIKKLQTLNTALQKKPALKLSISGHVSPSQDLEALRDEQLSRTLIEKGEIARSDIQQQSKNWQREVVKLFKQRFPNENTTQWQVMQMNDAMRDNEELEPSALPQLAAQRAIAVKQLLVADLGLAADRAFVNPVDLGADKNPGLQVTMQVE